MDAGDEEQSPILLSDILTVKTCQVSAMIHRTCSHSPSTKQKPIGAWSNQKFENVENTMTNGRKPEHGA